MKKLVLLIMMLLSGAVQSQSKSIDSTFLGKWRNDKIGINIYIDKVIMIVKNPSWVDSKKPEDQYTFKSTRVSTFETFETWVTNYKKGVKQLRILRFEKNDDVLKFYFSNVARSYDTDESSYYIRGVKPEEGFIKMVELQKEP